VQALRANLSRLKQDATVARADAAAFLAGSQAQYDIVFLDPPFTAQLWTTIAQQLLQHGRLKPDAWLYVESPAQEIPALPADFQLHRQGTAGAVRYALYRRSANL